MRDKKKGRLQAQYNKEKPAVPIDFQAEIRYNNYVCVKAQEGRYGSGSEHDRIWPRRERARWNSLRRRAEDGKS